jgi:hypothetical protein
VHIFVVFHICTRILYSIMVLLFFFVLVFVHHFLHVYVVNVRKTCFKINTFNDEGMHMEYEIISRTRCKGLKINVGLCVQ